MGTVKTVILTTAALGAAAVLGATALVYSGIYDVSAIEAHTQPVYSLLETAMRQSVRLRARNIEAPALSDPQLVQRGAACYQAKCLQCHGAPGVAQHDIGKSMQPIPGPLVNAAEHWKPRELYWVTKRGILMSGMPAWEFRMSEQDLWAVVAFLNRLPELTPQQYAALASDASAGASPAARCDRPQETSVESRPANAARGRVALYQYACTACHTIPGTTGSDPQVGPPLAGFGSRILIAGRLANTPDNLVLWLRKTREVDPLTAMPDMGVGEQDARDIAAYLASLR